VFLGRENSLTPALFCLVLINYVVPSLDISEAGIDIDESFKCDEIVSLSLLKRENLLGCLGADIVAGFVNLALISPNVPF